MKNIVSAIKKMTIAHECIRLQHHYGLSRGNKTSFSSLCEIGRFHGLGQSAQSVSPIMDGTDKIHLPLIEKDPYLSYDALYSPLAEAGQPLSVKSLSLFLSLSMGLSAWKKAGNSQWALRINPSSGNLHPSEAHLVVPLVSGINVGIFHYFSFEHALELRSNLPEGSWQQMESHFGGPGFIVALSTIYWRESWKYGERAFRYCNLDAGHALAALSMAARLLNWELTILTGAGDDQIRTILGFDQTPWQSLEEEVPELICWVSLDATAGQVPQSLPKNFGVGVQGSSI